MTQTMPVVKRRPERRLPMLTSRSVMPMTTQMEWRSITVRVRLGMTTSDGDEDDGWDLNLNSTTLELRDWWKWKNIEAQ